MFKGRRFPTDVILIWVRWYCKYVISYPDLEEMMSEPGVTVDHTTQESPKNIGVTRGLIP